MKRIYAIILAAVLLLSLAACGESAGTAAPTEPVGTNGSTEQAATNGSTGPVASNGAAFVGSWKYAYTNDKGTVVSKAFEIRADNTATIVTTQTHADGTVEEKTVDYTWELNENGQVVIRSEKHTAVFNFSEEKGTLTNRNATAEKFTRAQ